MNFSHSLLTAALMCGVALSAVPARAQAGLSCTLGKVTERVAPMYPTTLNQSSRPQEGLVSLLATFAPDGKVTSTKVMTGPSQLRFESESFVRGWRAEPSADIRQCAIVLEYRFDGNFRQCTSRSQIRIRAEREDDTHVLMHLSCDDF